MARIEKWLTAALVAVAVAMVASPASAQISGEAFLLSLSHTVGCTAQNASYCNATLDCWWSNDTQSCMPKVPFNGSINTTTDVATSWCFEYFPAPFITSVYFLCALLFGFSASGVIYNLKYYNVYTKVYETGERVFNTNYYKTGKENMYMLVLLLSSALLAITTANNWMDETSCTYIYGVYIFCVVVFTPPVAIPTYYFLVWAWRKCTQAIETGLNVDDYVVPATKEAVEDPLGNQVRMM